MHTTSTNHSFLIGDVLTCTQLLEIINKKGPTEGVTFREVESILIIN